MQSRELGCKRTAAKPEDPLDLFATTNGVSPANCQPPFPSACPPPPCLSRTLAGQAAAVQTPAVQKTQLNRVASAQADRAKHAAELAAYAQAYYAKHQAKLGAKAKAYRAKNKAKLAARRAAVRAAAQP